MKGIDLISCKEEVFTIADETLAQVAQWGGGCRTPGNIQGWMGFWAIGYSW